MLLIVGGHTHTAAIEAHVVRAARAALHGRPIVPVRAVVVQRTGRVGVTVADSGKLQMSKLKRADVYKSDERRKTYTALPVFQRTMGVIFCRY